MVIFNCNLLSDYFLLKRNYLRLTRLMIQSLCVASVDIGDMENDSYLKVSQGFIYHYLIKKFRKMT